MAKTKFTPGPWRTERPDQDCNWLSIIIGDCHKIAEVTYDRLEASNAHLIAAAPDLYEALELILELRGKELGEWLLTPNAKHLTLKEYAQAALAKARGEGNG